MKVSLRRIPLAAVLFAALSTSAAAQNAGQIAHVKAGGACPRCNLFQADFANLNLKGRNLSGARLRQADLSTAEAGRARFTGGDLRDLNAYGAVMGGADFAHADLTNATFVGAYLEGANFAGATLAGANFSGAEMARARGLSPARLAEACGDASTTLPRGLRLKACS
jgi:uncharacterized protein YjbI with pentapeptide repeats